MPSTSLLSASKFPYKSKKEIVCTVANWTEIKYFDIRNILLEINRLQSEIFPAELPPVLYENIQHIILNREKIYVTILDIETIGDRLQNYSQCLLPKQAICASSLTVTLMNCYCLLLTILQSLLKKCRKCWSRQNNGVK